MQIEERQKEKEGRKGIEKPERELEISIQSVVIYYSILREEDISPSFSINSFVLILLSIILS